jgi:hypothetical protein
VAGLASERLADSSLRLDQAQLKAVISFSSEEDMPCLEITPAPYELEEDKLVSLASFLSALIDLPS